MLVLNTRKESKIFVGENIVIHVLGSDRIGIEADRSIKVLRGSVVERDASANANVHHSGRREGDSGTVNADR